MQTTTKQTKYNRTRNARKQPTKNTSNHAPSMVGRSADSPAVADMAEFISLLQNTPADTLGDILPVARRAAGGGVPVKYHATDGTMSRSALLIISAVPGYRYPAPLAAFRGTVIRWDAEANPTASVVSYPPLALVENASITPVVRNPAAWTISPMRDETVITLYHLDGWKMSSARGIDVSDHCWMDAGITFSEALAECLGEEFSWANLDREWCYTVGFHHHKMHPFMSDPQHATLLQAAHVAGRLTPRVLSCAADTRDEFNAIAASLHLVADAPVELPDLSAKKLKSWLILNNKHALNNYVQNVYRGNACVPIHYGYILRSSTEGISLPSSLFHLIKQSVYSFPPEANLTADNRRKYIILRACMTPSAKYNFLRLFPQWTDEYRVYEQFINDTALAIVGELSKREVGAEAGETSPLVSTLIESVRTFGVNPIDAQAVSIVADIITTPSNLDLLMKHAPQ